MVVHYRLKVEAAVPRKPAVNPPKRVSAPTRVTDATYRALQAEAEMRQVPVSAVVRWAIDAWLKRRMGGSPEQEAM